MTISLYIWWCYHLFIDVWWCMTCQRKLVVTSRDKYKYNDCECIRYRQSLVSLYKCAISITMNHMTSGIPHWKPKRILKESLWKLYSFLELAAVYRWQSSSATEHDSQILLLQSQCLMTMGLWFIVWSNHVKSQFLTYYSGWWFGTFFHISGIIIPIDFRIFQLIINHH